MARLLAPLAVVVAGGGCGSRPAALADGGPSDDAPGSGATLVTGSDAEFLLACNGQEVWSRPNPDADASATDGGAAGGGGWSQRFGSLVYDWSNAVATDEDGDLFLGSTHGGSVDFGEGPLPPYCTFLSSFGASGSHRWSRSIAYGGGKLSVRSGLGIIAWLQGSVASFAPDGTTRWVRKSLYGQRQAEMGPEGSVLVLSDTSGVGYSASRVEKLSPAGDPIWARDVAVISPLMAVSEAGEIYLCMVSDGTSPVFGESFLSQGGSIILIAKLDADGNVAWIAPFASTGVAGCSTVSAVADGVIMSGLASSPLNFGGGAIGAGSNPFTFLVKLDGGGHHVASRVSSVASEVLGGATPTSEGGLVRWGNFRGSLDVEGTTVHTAGGDGDFLTVTYSAALGLEQVQHFGNGGGAQSITGLGIDPAGAMLLGGGFEGHLDLGSGTLRSAGGADVFIARVEP